MKFEIKFRNFQTQEEKSVNTNSKDPEYRIERQKLQLVWVISQLNIWGQIHQHKQD